MEVYVWLLTGGTPSFRLLIFWQNMVASEPYQNEQTEFLQLGIGSFRRARTIGHLWDTATEVLPRSATIIPVCGDPARATVNLDVSGVPGGMCCDRRPLPIFRTPHDPSSPNSISHQRGRPLHFCALVRSTRICGPGKGICLLGLSAGFGR
jgi:hypothetical protein